MKAQQLPGLNLLRVFASLYMVMYHVHPPFLPVPLQNFFSDGASDTSLFFILSGFLLAHLYAGKEMDGSGQRGFVWRRMARIFPANLLGLLFVLLAQAAFGNTFNDWGTLAQCLALVQAWTVGSSYALNVPAWSMSCLFFFYLLFPVVMPVLRKMTTGYLQILLLIVWISSAFVVPLLSRWPGVFGTESWIQYLHNSPLPRSLEFVLGVGLALLIARKGMLSVWWFRLAVPAVFCAMLTASGETVRIDNGLLAPISAVLILAFANPGPLVERLGRSKAIEVLASASICVFLLHMTWAQIFTAWALPHWHTGWNILTLGLYLAVVAGSAVMLDCWICQPVSRLVTRRPVRRASAGQPRSSSPQPSAVLPLAAGPST
ncbi:acyltransferase family protein [Deinococcus altitudinis]|uniref:acyltransferase family protein n=1 Tax=Deinococcus altitudinis TaxID=468914 RepID=UPI0038922731